MALEVNYLSASELEEKIEGLTYRRLHIWTRLKVIDPKFVLATNGAGNKRRRLSPDDKEWTRVGTGNRFLYDERIIPILELLIKVQRVFGNTVPYEILRRVFNDYRLGEAYLAEGIFIGWNG